MGRLLSNSGITYRISCPYTPQQNGVAERKNRHLSEIALSLLSHAKLSKEFWYDAYATAAFLINRQPSQLLDHHSPYEILFHSLPDYTLFRTFGCLCYPFLGSIRSDKLEPKSTPCIFLGYASNHKGYLCYDPRTGKTYTSRHVIFHETTFLSTAVQSPSSSSTHVTFPSYPLSHPSTSDFSSSSDMSPFMATSSHSLDISSSPSSSSSPPPSSLSPLSPPSPPPPPPPPRHPMVTRSRDHSRQVKTFPDHVLFHTSLTPPDCEPTSFLKAQKWPEWLDAMRSELTALHNNQTWILVPPPSDVSVIGSKWVYQIKRNPDGFVSRYKARLVA